MKRSTLAASPHYRWDTVQAYDDYSDSFSADIDAIKASMQQANKDSLSKLTKKYSLSLSINLSNNFCQLGWCFLLHCKQDFMRLHNFTIVQCNYFQAIPLLEDQWHTFTCWSLISRIFFIHIQAILLVHKNILSHCFFQLHKAFNIGGSSKTQITLQRYCFIIQHSIFYLITY